MIDFRILAPVALCLFVGCAHVDAQLEARCQEEAPSTIHNQAQGYPVRDIPSGLNISVHIDTGARLDFEALRLSRFEYQISIPSPPNEHTATIEVFLMNRSVSAECLKGDRFTLVYRQFVFDINC